MLAEEAEMASRPRSSRPEASAGGVDVVPQDVDWRDDADEPPLPHDRQVMEATLAQHGRPSSAGANSSIVTAGVVMMSRASVSCGWSRMSASMRSISLTNPMTRLSPSTTGAPPNPCETNVAAMSGSGVSGLIAITRSVMMLRACPRTRWLY
jgi:hypothetical protein